MAAADMFPRTSSSTSALSALPEALSSFSAEAIATSLFAINGNVPFVQAALLNGLLFGLLSRKLFTMLTPAGFAHSLALGTMLWTTLGWRGWLVCVIYLFLGQLVTKVGFAEKTALGIAEGRGGRRGPENVWGSAATGLACAACAAQTLGSGAFLGISYDAWLLAYVASLATKLSDTFASEIGKAYGKTAFLITTFERVEAGTEGAVSLEGTAASVVGGFSLSMAGYLMGFISVAGVGVSTVAAFLATNVESWLGATLQEKPGWEWMTNEVVNFLNTLIGASIALGLGVKFLGL